MGDRIEHETPVEHAQTTYRPRADGRARQDGATPVASLTNNTVSDAPTTIADVATKISRGAK
jgi:hypothetical protein